MVEEDELKFNISLLGASHVGKSSMITRFKGFGFNETTIQTIGVENYTYKMTLDKKNCKFIIFDTAGQERYSNISRPTILLANGFILVFDVADDESFKNINTWLEYIKESVKIEEKVIFLVGNKIDLTNRKITKENAEKFAKEKGFKYFETSAKTGESINEVFIEMSKDVFDLYKKTENDDFSIQKSFSLDDNRDIIATKKKKKCC